MARRRLLGRNFRALNLVVFSCVGLSCSPETTAAAVDEDNGFVAGHAVLDVAVWDEQFRKSEVKAQENIRACMAEEGFDYEPPPVESGLTEQADDALRSGDLSDAAFAADFGFGVSTLQDFVFVDETSEEAITQFESPPTTNLGEMGLTGPELAAFERTLYGDGSLDSGCVNKGYAEHRQWSDQIAPLYEDIDRAKAAFLLDLRVTSFYEKWSRCMTGEGFENFVAPLQIHQELTASMIGVMDRKSASELDQLRDYEVDIAQATVRCGESTLSLVPPDLLSVWSEML